MAGAIVSGPSRLRRLSLAIAAICFVFGFTGRGLIESFVVFLLPLSSELGLDRAATASIYAISVLMTGIGGPVVGRLFDRAGPRIVYSVGLTLLGGGLSLAAFATELFGMACPPVARAVRESRGRSAYHEFLYQRAAKR
jgi:MFS family permease